MKGFGKTCESFHLISQIIAHIFHELSAGIGTLHVRYYVGLPKRQRAGPLASLDKVLPFGKVASTKK